MSTPVEIDPDKPIVYGRPRYLAPLLIVAATAALLGVALGFATRNDVRGASTQDVLQNRAVTEKLTELVRQFEANNQPHRERNEEAHACLIWLAIRAAHARGDWTVDVDFPDPHPCAKYTRPGVVPPTTTTSTTGPRRHPTTTTQRHRSTTTTTHASSTTHPTTTTQACPGGTIPAAGVCQPTPTTPGAP